MNSIRSLFVPPLFLLLIATTVTTQAGEQTIKVTMPWDGEGTVYMIGTGKALFMGAFEGIMYVEKEEGELDAAFANCPATQHIDVETGSSSADGYCNIAVSGEDAVFAKWSCEGKIGTCKGNFELTGGTGRFEGVSGSSQLVVRSVLNALVSGLGDGEVVRTATGIAVLPRLTYQMTPAQQ